jgi:2-methylaconitate cis-trans-isomerase PrpF
MAALACTLMRGGTSKGVFIHRRELPDGADERDALLLRLMGSPDRRQIDGLGGADPLTSKVVIMDADAPDGCDATYTYGRVSVLEPHIGWSTNCGNLSAAAAVFAIEEGFTVAATDAPYTTVRLFNTNTGTVLVVHVPTDGSGFVPEGDTAIAGVPGTGSAIRLDFAATVGANTGTLLPLGAPVVEIEVSGRAVEVSVVDVAKPAVFVRAEDVGLTATIHPDDATNEQVSTLWAIRDAVADLLDLGPEAAHIPTPVAVGPPAGYRAFGSGDVITADTVDVCARAAGRRGHGLAKTSAATNAVCGAVAAVTPGTVVHRVRGGDGSLVRLGHASGVMPLVARYADDGSLAEASFVRTARRLMDGVAYVR